MRPERRDAAGMSEDEAKQSAKPNKLHEWTAAIALMMLLTAILFGFLHFLRGVSF
ncbi:MAG: hypothetical protein K0S65_2871 [Labilithrix sp.]|nr:hypothetical protein [Labilithrix sp.]